MPDMIFLVLVELFESLEAEVVAANVYSLFINGKPRDLNKPRSTNFSKRLGRVYALAAFFMFSRTLAFLRSTLALRRAFFSRRLYLLVMTTSFNPVNGSGEMFM